MNSLTNKDFIKKEELNSGLYLVATPIGNLADITLRALSILSSVDYILCEDKRVSAKLLSYYGINTKLLSYHDHNADKMIPKILNLLKKNKSLALISDAGTPLLSDPGYNLVQKMLVNNFYITSIPGASALLTALTISCLPMNSFYYAGFLPNKKSKRRDFLDNLKEIPTTMVFYESPKRLADCLKDAYEIMGNRKIAIGRELTKLYEEMIRGKVLDIIDQIKNDKITLKGEIVIIIEGFVDKELSKEHILDLLKKELANNTTKGAVELVSKKYRLSKKIVYNLALKLKATNNTII